MVVQGARRLCVPFPTQGPRSVETAPRLPLSTLSSPPTNVCLTVIHRVKGAAQTADVLLKASVPTEALNEFQGSSEQSALRWLPLEHGGTRARSKRRPKIDAFRGDLIYYSESLDALKELIPLLFHTRTGG